MQIHLITAARPNFMKIAPLYHALKDEDWAQPIIVHTGQHYDLNMSEVFFSDLKLPAPHIYLGVGSGSHAEQTGKVMIAYEKVLLETQPELIIVVGDVNSTLACTLAGKKVEYAKPKKLMDANPPTALSRPVVAHLEAGLRSFDRTMPEEINRIATDVLADILWTPSSDGDKNLLREGIEESKIERVGNIMIDSLEMMRHTIEQQDTFIDFGLRKGEYGVVTFHRPVNVDDTDILTRLCECLIQISGRLPLIFPIHPRTRKNLEKYGIMSKLESIDTIIAAEPLNYVRFMNLLFNCRLAITDSGGIQEETTYLGIPCLTMRPNTERPVTIIQGTNRLCSLFDLQKKAEGILADPINDRRMPELWDGRTAMRVTNSIKTFFGNDKTLPIEEICC